MTWTYHQRSGQLVRNGKLVATGYSGHGEDRNKPELQGEKGRGPIPRGEWTLDGVYNSKQCGPLTIILSPAPGTDTLGRSGFRIHGDNQKGDFTASDGCIILPREIREQMWGFKDHKLLVVE